MSQRRKKPELVNTVEKHGYEFFGPPGAFVLTFGLPLLVFATTMLCNDVSGCPAPALLHPKTLTLNKLKAQTPWPKEGIWGLIDPVVIGWVLAYHGLSFVLQLVLPGIESEGTVLGTGGRHTYKFNAFASGMLIYAGLALGTAMHGANFIVWTFIWDNLNKIIMANLLYATATAVFVYLRSFSVPAVGAPNADHRELAKGGHSGNILYDYFIGRELSPRLKIPEWIPIAGGQIFDIKVFNEVRPGLTGWAILDAAFMARQYRLYGYVTDSMILATAFNTLYVVDCLYMESSILTQMDITTDGFGFMLSFGDLVWLPFIYSMPARYLASYPVHLGFTGIITIFSIQALGFYIFRSANNERYRFRTNPNDPRISHLESITTHTGSKLITSGWWGRARHVNYLGDWIMSWSYCMPTGVAGYIIHKYPNPVTGGITRRIEQGEARGWGMIFTYFYIVYFGTLLVHRERRDDDKCRRKYGKDWEKYTQKVKSRIIPGIY